MWESMSPPFFRNPVFFKTGFFVLDSFDLASDCMSLFGIWFAYYDLNLKFRYFLHRLWFSIIKDYTRNLIFDKIFIRYEMELFSWTYFNYFNIVAFFSMDIKI